MSRVSDRLWAPPQIIALIGGLHPHLKKKVRAALEAILSDPHAGKALKDGLAGLRSFRIGQVRIVYRIAASRVIELVAIGPRERIYEATYRRIAKHPEPEPSAIQTSVHTPDGADSSRTAIEGIHPS